MNWNYDEIAEKLAMRRTDVDAAEIPLVLEEARKRRDGNVIAHVASWYEDVKDDKARYLELAKEAAELGSPEANFWLGHEYLSGVNLPRDYEKAREGKRFNNEMATRDVMSAAILNQTGKTSYLLFDQGVRDSLKAIEGYASQGLLTQADTLAGLAEKLGMPAANLEATVASYNKIQASGNDTEFGRAASDMPRAIATAPYYAIEVGPAIHHTMGGIKINTNAEILDTSDKVVPGLYAAGEVTGGVHGGNRLGGLCRHRAVRV